MVDKPQNSETPAGGEATPAPAPAPRRGMGHRGTDIRDTVAEMTERAQQLSLEAGSKIAGAMREVIYAAAGIAGFTVESARDLVQYMVRRGQISADEGERLLREAEEGAARGGRTVAAPAAPAAAEKPAAPAPAAPKAPAAAPARAPEVEKPAEKAAPARSAPAAKKAAPKVAARPEAKKPAAKAAKAPAKPAAKSASKPAAKKAAAKKKK